MRTRTLLFVVAALATTTPAAARADGPDASLVACHRALSPADRYLTVEGLMAGVPGSARMEMRFDLYRRRQGTASFARVPGPGLGVYNRAAPGVGEYRFRKTVRNLPAPADYRVTITFRWLGADGSAVSKASRSAALCRQSEQRPDLRAGAIDVAALADGRARYTVTVRNTGGSAARGFAVALSIAGSRLPAARVTPLGPGERSAVSFVAAACSPGQAIVASVDPGRQVDEASESNNARGIPCPSLH